MGCSNKRLCLVRTSVFLFNTLCLFEAVCNCRDIATCIVHKTLFYVAYFTTAYVAVSSFSYFHVQNLVLPFICRNKIADTWRYKIYHARTHKRYIRKYKGISVDTYVYMFVSIMYILRRSMCAYIDVFVWYGKCNIATDWLISQKFPKFKAKKCCKDR